MLSKIKIFIFLFSITALYCRVFSQGIIIPKKANEEIKFISKTDSLKIIINSEKEDTNKANNLNVLCWEYKKTGLYDTAQYYGLLAQKLAQKCNFKKGLANAYNNLGLIYCGQGNYPQALENSFAALKIREKVNDKKRIAMSYNNIGMIYCEQGNYSESLKNHFASLKLKEALKDKSGITMSYNNIGNVYMYSGNYPEALKNHFAALKTRKEMGDKYGISSSYINIGTVYFKQDNYNEALKNLFAGLKIKEELGEKNAVAMCYGNIGSIYYKQNNYAEAQKNHFAALKIQEEIGDKKGIAISLCNVGNCYALSRNYPEAITYLKKGIQLSKEIGAKDLLADAYKLLYETYSRMSDHKNALEYHELYRQLKDSILNEKNSEQINRMQIEYETEKKEKEISLLNAANEIKKEKITILQKTNEVKRLTIFILAGCFVFAVVLCIFLFQWNRSRQNKKLQAEELKHQQEQLKAVVFTQEEERKRIAKDLHDGIGQLLAGLKLGWENISEEINSSYPQIKEKLKNNSIVLDEAANEVRSISHQMMPRVLNVSGIAPAIEDMLAKSFSGTTIKYDFQHMNMSGRFSENIEVGLFRIAQELVSNILKHAQATEINVRLFKNAQHIILMVEDNGKGFNFAEKKGKGLGLMNIFSRAQLINGEVSYANGILLHQGTSADKKGTVVTIRVPIA